MGELILAVLGILLLIVSRGENTVTNPVLLAKVSNIHSRVKAEMESIIYAPYSSTKKKTMRWASWIFIGLAILNLFTVKIFGPDSIKNPLKNPTILYSTFALMIIALGNFDRKDLLKFALLFIFSGIASIYIAHNPINFFAGHQSPTNILSNSPILKDLLIVLGTFGAIAMMFLIVFTARGICFVCYLMLQLLLKACIEGNGEKPLKPFVFLVGILFTLSVAVGKLI